MRHLLAAAAFALAIGCGGTSVQPADDGCSVRLAPGVDDQLSVQTALIAAVPGSTVCLESGTYHLTDELSLSVPGITLRGEGNATFDFAAGSLLVTANDVTVENVSFRRDGVVVSGADNVALRGLRIRAGGADSVVIERSSNVTVEGCSLVGGVVVSDTDHVLIERNRVRRGGITLLRSPDALGRNNTVR